MSNEFLFEASTKLSIVIPAFNEERRLPKLFRSLYDLPGKPSDYEIIVVDDGSKDNTTAISEIFIKEFNCLGQVITLPKNMGKGNALREGARLANSPLLLTLDADQATDLSVLTHALDLLAKHHMVIGSRNLPESKTFGMTLRRRLLTKGFSQLFRLVTNIELSDTQCGFKAYRTPVAKCLFASSLINGFAQDAELIYIARSNNLSIAEVAVHWTAIPESKVKIIQDSAKSLFELLIRRRTSEGLFTFNSLLISNIAQSDSNTLIRSQIFPKGSLYLWRNQSLRVLSPDNQEVDDVRSIARISDIVPRAQMKMEKYPVVAVLELLE